MNDMTLCMIVQARMGSTRLPAKSLALVQNKPLLWHVLRALEQVPAHYRIVACDAYSEEYFIPIVAEFNWILCVGHSYNVLERFMHTSNKYPSELIMRATGDNPLVSARMAKQLLAQRHMRADDYAHYSYLPIGCGVELFTRAALERAYEEHTTDYEREHVTPYIYEHPDLFHIGQYRCEFERNTSFTVDTKADYERICMVFDRLYTGVPIEIEQLCGYSDAYDGV